MKRAPFLILVAVAAAGAAPAGGVRGRVRVTRAGQEGRDAQVVVYLTGFAEPPPDAQPELRQQGRQFQPQLLAITAGQTLAFPNADPLLHNVFSLSPARRFDLGQFKAGETQVKQLPRPGVVEVCCDIHPDMAATILVLPNRRFTEARPDGSFALDGVPPGTWTLDEDAARARAGHTNTYGLKYAGSP